MLSKEEVSNNDNAGGGCQGVDPRSQLEKSHVLYSVVDGGADGTCGASNAEEVDP